MGKKFKTILKKLFCKHIHTKQFNLIYNPKDHFDNYKMIFCTDCKKLLKITNYYE